jgi:type I restriction enzyme R subunit
MLKLFKDIPKDKYDRGTLLKAVEVLTMDEGKGKKFQEDYRKLRKIFELLGPDEIKVERFSEYKWVSAIYTYYVRLVLRSQPSYERYVQKYFDKTVKFVHRTTELENLEKELPIIRFDENYLKVLEEKVKSREEKAANIVFTLNRLVLVERHKNPVYESLVDKVERILRLWKEKTKDFERIYRKGAEVVREIGKLSERQKELGFTDMEYSLLLALEKRFGRDEGLTGDVRELAEVLSWYMFPGWCAQPTARKKIEKEVRRFGRRYVKKLGISLEELNELHHQLMENVKNYGRAS